MTDFKPIRDACAMLGSQSALARELGVPQSVISRWAKGELEVPYIHCVQIEELTGGQVTRKQLRPDDWWKMWPELRGMD